MKKSCQAFTLIEVTLGMAILILIFGVIFQLVQVSVVGADDAGKYSLRNREVSGLFALLRQVCLDLPIKSQMGLVPRNGGGYDLVMTNAPLAILPDRYEGTRVLELCLSKSATGDGRVLALVERFEPGNQPGRATKGGQTNSFVLMGDIQSMKWAVWDPRSQQEMGEWDQPVKPSYLKLELVRKDGARSLTNVGIFWIPTGLGPGGQTPADTITKTGLATTNTGTNSP